MTIKTHNIFQNCLHVLCQESGILLSLRLAFRF